MLSVSVLSVSALSGVRVFQISCTKLILVKIWSLCDVLNGLD